MRHGLANRRPRNRGPHNPNNNSNNTHPSGNRRPQNQRTQVFDSNGPDVRIRGTAHQVTEKYMLLARDAASAGDRVLSESYLQHAEHYQRVINSWEAENPQRPPAPVSEEAFNEQPVTVNRTGDNLVSESDLQLPASILGGVPEAKDQQKEAVRSSEDDTLSMA